jgi:large subunit ribosomal protein L36
MKVRSSLKSLRNKPGSVVVRRKGKTYIINKNEPRNNVRQG